MEFASRHGDDLLLWVAFERVGDGQISPHLEHIDHLELTRYTPELVDVVEFLGLRMLPPS